ncbi:MAG: hypothetical protein AB7H66_11075 [Hyphomonadaceae bacterium]
MQLPILRSLALVMVGNAALAGRNVSGFYPGDPLFRYTASLDFMTPRQEGPLAHVAPGPVSWFEKLRKRQCIGLRLHNAPMQQNQKLGHIDERLLVGMVGGGPRWLIETVYPERSELWEGFDRVGDKKAKDGKIWLSAYVLLGEADSAERVDSDIAGASNDLRGALVSIEDVARAMPGTPFADAFAGARQTLDGQDLPYPLEFLNYTFLAPDARRLLNATGKAWVFGAMGSWNDLVPEAVLKSRYEAASKTLFAALQRAVLVAANSTYRG